MTDRKYRRPRTFEEAGSSSEMSTDKLLAGISSLLGEGGMTTEEEQAVLTLQKFLIRRMNG